MIRSTIADSENLQKVSSKRIAALVLVLCLVIVVIGNMFFRLKIDDFIFAGLTEAVIWSLGFVGAERFSTILPGKRPKRDTEEDMI